MTPADLRAYSERHLYYELSMLYETAARLKPNTASRTMRRATRPTEF
jgi:hypothetical protein